MQSIEQMLARLDTAIKEGITTTDLGSSILNPMQFAAFVRAMQAKTCVIPEARYINMTSEKANIDRVGFVGRVLSGGKTQDGTQNVPTQVKPSYQTNQLIAQELVAITGLYDTAKRRNIELDQHVNTLIALLGEAGGRDAEEYGLLADKDYAGEDDYLFLTDGWVKLAANKIYGVGASKDFDPSATFDPDDPMTLAFPENMFEAMLSALPKEYLQDRSSWRLYASFGVVNDYANILKARQTALGDIAQTTGGSQAAQPNLKTYWLPFKGIPVVHTPMIERSAAVGDGGAGDVALLSHPDNMPWGVFEQVTVEPERKPQERKTNFVLTMEADVNYEDENAAVASYIDQEVPGS